MDNINKNKYIFGTYIKKRHLYSFRLIGNQLHEPPQERDPSVKGPISCHLFWVITLPNLDLYILRTFLSIKECVKSRTVSNRLSLVKSFKKERRDCRVGWKDGTLWNGILIFVLRIFYSCSPSTLHRSKLLSYLPLFSFLDLRWKGFMKIRRNKKKKGPEDKWFLEK